MVLTLGPPCPIWGTHPGVVNLFIVFIYYILLLLPLIAIPIGVFIAKQSEARSNDIVGNRLRKAEKLAKKQAKEEAARLAKLEKERKAKEAQALAEKERKRRFIMTFQRGYKKFYKF